MRDEMWMKSAGEKIARELGAEIISFLNDESVTEIMLNQDGTVWIDRMGEGMSKTGVVMAREKAMLVIGSVAAYKHTTVQREKTAALGDLPGGQRFQAMIERLRRLPCFPYDAAEGRAQSARLRAGENDGADIPAPSKSRRGTAEHNRIRRHRFRQDDAFVALLAEIGRLCPEDRIAVMEDTPELQIVNRNAVFERITDNACASALLAANLRMRPDRIILGETRGAEAMELLKAWNTGHPGGICTIHANSATSALSRLETLILESNISGMTLPFIRSLIADAVNLVVHVQKDRRIGPVVSEVLEVSGLDIDGAYQTSVVEKRKD